MRTAVSLFSGCGGSDYGLQNAGYSVIFANDVLKYAKDVYMANISDVEYVNKDITQVSSFPSADLLCGCYPCQGFSQGGVRKADRNINFLYREFDRALRLIKPKAFVVENVSGMRRADLKHLLANQLRRFRLAGYRVNWKVLDAKDFGVPQDRLRLFIVGIRSDLGEVYEFPEPTYGTSAQPYNTIRTAIGDMPEWPEGEFNAEKFHWYYLSRNRHRGWDEPSKTIVARGRHVPLHPSSPKLIRVHTDKWVFESDAPARRLSYRECARLQGFPVDMRFPDTAGIAERYKVIGNAVPPPLFEAVVRNIPDIW